jgi:hypothetical protein
MGLEAVNCNGTTRRARDGSWRGGAKVFVKISSSNDRKWLKQRGYSENNT